MKQPPIDRFDKVSILGRESNLFLRVEELERLVKQIKTGNITQNITNLIQQNQEIILSSIAGGTVDPTDPAFTGIVISPSGQTINGILYNFALVEGGSVITGWGQDVNNTTIIQGAKTSLTGNVTYYVRADGNDGNSGLVDDSTGAFLTPQKAWDTIVNGLLLNGYTATMQIRSGTYPGINMGAYTTGLGYIVIQGNALDVDDVVLVESAGMTASITNLGAYGFINIRDLTMDADFCISALYGSVSCDNVKLSFVASAVDALMSEVSLNIFEIASASPASLIDARRSTIHLYDATLHGSQYFSSAMLVLDDGAEVIIYTEITDPFTGKGYDLKNMSRIVTSWDIIGDTANTTDGTCVVTGFIDPFGAGGTDLSSVRKSISIGF